MLFNKRSNLEGTHALLSPSDYHWVNYDEDKIERVYYTKMAARRGVEFHDFAQIAIRLGVKLPDLPITLNMYVNDGIGYGMTTEQVLYYSDNCYGHADCIAFRNDTLRISDLKTGINESSFKQLIIYVALFCLEYKFNPFKINIELRIYQNDEVRFMEPDPDEVFHVMDRITTFSKRLDYLKREVES